MSALKSVVARTTKVQEETEKPSTSGTDGGKVPGMDVLTSRTGGAYIPPARLKMMQDAIRDKGSMQFQRIAWESLKKSINGLINKVNVSNIAIIVRELFRENLIRGRGLLCKSILQAQAASPLFTHVYAAVVAVLNSKFPQIGELLLKRLIIQFRKSYKRNDKQSCLTSCRFIAHLVNQEVAHEVVALEILTLLLENTTNDSIEVAVGFLKEAGMKLTDLSPRGINAIFERLRTILHEGQLDQRVMYMIEVIFAIRKDNFKDHPAVVQELDLIEESEQNTHLLTLEDPTDPEDKLNVFHFDPDFEKNEEKYKTIKKEILDAGSGDESDDDDDGSEEEDEDDDEENGPTQIIDNTETNLTELRRTIYLTIQSSLDFEECCHKLLKHELKGPQVTELCHMIIDCCAQQRTYIKFYGLLAQRFCNLSDDYVENFSEIFKSCYDTIHRFETNKLRNVAKLFAHLFFTDAISWELLAHIKLNEDDTTSSSRVFIKILFQELAEYMGMGKLNERIKDPTLQEAFAGLFPRDNPRDSRFSINFFTSIGLGGLTDDLRTHLQSVPKPQPLLTPAILAAAVAGDNDSSSSPSSSSDSSSSSSDSEDSVTPPPRKRQRKSRSKDKESRSRVRRSVEKDKERRRKTRTSPDRDASRRKSRHSPDQEEKCRHRSRHSDKDTKDRHESRRSVEKEKEQRHRNRNSDGGRRRDRSSLRHSPGKHRHHRERSRD